MPMKIEKSGMVAPEKIGDRAGRPVVGSKRDRKRRDSGLIKSGSPRTMFDTRPTSQAKEVHSERAALKESIEISPFSLHTYSLYLPLAPISQQHAVPGLCAEHLSPLILVYYTPFKGVILSYSNPRLSIPSHTSIANSRQTVHARSVDEYAATFTWLTADFLLFRPEKGSLIDGHIVLQTKSSLGIVCWNFFNASIESRRLPHDWKWIHEKPSKTNYEPREAETSATRKLEESRRPSHGISKAFDDSEGHFEDGAGRKIKGMIRFRVRKVVTSEGIGLEHGFLNIEGTMLDTEDEFDLQKKDAAKSHDYDSRLIGNINVQDNRSQEARTANPEKELDI